MQVTDGGSERDELSTSLVTLVSSLGRLEVLKLRLQASCMTPAIITGIVAGLGNLQRLKLTCSDGWTNSSLFIPLTALRSLRKCSLAHFKQAEDAKAVRLAFRTALPYCKIKTKYGQD